MKDFGHLDSSEIRAVLFAAVEAQADEIERLHGSVLDLNRRLTTVQARGCELQELLDRRNEEIVVLCNARDREREEYWKGRNALPDSGELSTPKGVTRTPG
mgnify:CR=1 FL=1